MKSLSIVGGILLLISGAMFYYSTDFLLEKITMSHMMGVMGGIGIGLIIGGIVGYISKGSAIREEKKRKQLAQLQKQNKELEKKVESINNDSCSFPFFMCKFIIQFFKRITTFPPHNTCYSILRIFQG